MLQIRHGVFETNSSSTHSISICKKSEYDAWVRGEVYLNDGWWSKVENEDKNKKFLTKEEAMKLIADSGYYEDVYSLDEEELSEVFYDECIYDVESYGNMCEYYEEYAEEYTTDSGETIIAFGYYGNDY